MTQQRTLYCHFCGKSQKEVSKLIAGPMVYICDECIELSAQIITEEDPKGVGALEAIEMRIGEEWVFAVSDRSKEGRDRFLQMLRGQDPTAEYRAARYIRISIEETNNETPEKSEQEAADG